MKQYVMEGLDRPANRRLALSGQARVDYDLELDRVADEIKKNHAKTVCIQLPDGLKPEAKNIADELEKKTGANVLIWIGSCYGACDIPLAVKELDVDLLVQWGHSKWEP